MIRLPAQLVAVSLCAMACTERPSNAWANLPANSQANSRASNNREALNPVQTLMPQRLLASNERSELQPNTLSASDLETKFKKALPVKIYDSDSPAWRTTLDPDGKITMNFSQGDFIKGWGNWKLEDLTLTVHHVFQQQKDPTSGKAVQDKEHGSDTEYTIGVKDGALTIDGNEIGKDGVFSIPPR
jgi:hypothetical protein